MAFHPTFKRIQKAGMYERKKEKRKKKKKVLVVKNVC